MLLGTQLKHNKQVSQTSTTLTQAIRALIWPKAWGHPHRRRALLGIVVPCLRKRHPLYHSPSLLGNIHWEAHPRSKGTGSLMTKLLWRTRRMSRFPTQPWHILNLMILGSK